LARRTAGDAVVVIGLGRFGGAVAETIVGLGQDVLGIDENSERAQAWAERLTHVVQADSTEAETLRRLGVADFTRAVVAIGSDVEASVLTVLALSELGVPEIWAKALSSKHGRILERTGAHRVVYPEADMGRRVAMLVATNMLDLMEFPDGMAIGQTRVPEDALGRTLVDCAIRLGWEVQVIGVKRRGQPFVPATPETRLQAEDVLIVSGETRRVEAFAAGG
jgi:trk system potassium uptake protein TrkA